jgi:hypothetical protein
MESLPSLPVGDAWFWSPGWPTAGGIFKRVHVLPIETFDSGATPKPGEKRHEPKTVADVDLDALKRQMSATIEKAKADDPRELRKRIADLERQAKSRSVPAKAVPVLKDSQIARVEKLVERFDKALATAMQAYGAACEQLRQLVSGVHAVRQEASRTAPAPPASVRRAEPAGSPGRSSTPARPVVSRAVSPESNGHLPPARQRILNGLAFLHGIGVAPADKTQLALMIGVSPTSGGFFNNLGGLRSDGLIHYPAGGTVALTDAGAALASTAGIPQTTDELHEAIRAKLPPAKWRILDALIAAYPKAVHKDVIAEQIGVSPTSGGFFNNLGSLRSLGLIDYPQPGHAAALPVLFLE